MNGSAIKCESHNNKRQNNVFPLDAQCRSHIASKNIIIFFFQFIIALESHFRIRISSNILFGGFFFPSSCFLSLLRVYDFGSLYTVHWTLYLSNFSFDDGHFVILSSAWCAITRVKICFQCNARGCFDHFSQSY